MVFFVSLASAESNLVQGAVDGKRIRVRRVIITTDTNGSVMLMADPSGANTPVMPRLEARAAGSPVDLYFEREFPITGSGEALGFSTDVGGRHGLWIEYELVA